MNTREFDAAIRRLEDGFGLRLQKGQLGVWYEKLRGWSRRKIELVVDRALSECDKLPSLAMLRRIGEAIPIEATTGPKTDCRFCAGRGIISAEKRDTPEQARPYVYAFRCPHCNNWEGRESLKIPMWSQAHRDRGYRPLFPYLEDPTKADLEAMRDFAPSIFNQFLEANPAWGDTFQPVEIRPFAECGADAMTRAVEKAVEMAGPPPGPEDVVRPAIQSFAEMSMPPECEEEWVPR